MVSITAVTASSQPLDCVVIDTFIPALDEDQVESGTRYDRENNSTRCVEDKQSPCNCHEVRNFIACVCLWNLKRPLAVSLQITTCIEPDTYLL